MKAYDYYAVVLDCDVLCVECLPAGVGVDDEEVHPIFAISEWDYYPICCKCGAQHDYITLIGGAK